MKKSKSELQRDEIESFLGLFKVDYEKEKFTFPFDPKTCLKDFAWSTFFDSKQLPLLIAGNIDTSQDGAISEEGN